MKLSCSSAKTSPVETGQQFWLWERRGLCQEFTVSWKQESMENEVAIIWAASKGQGCIHRPGVSHPVRKRRVFPVEGTVVRSRGAWDRWHPVRLKGRKSAGCADQGRSSLGRAERRTGEPHTPSSALGHTILTGDCNTTSAFGELEVSQSLTNFRKPSSFHKAHWWGDHTKVGSGALGLCRVSQWP